MIILADYKKMYHTLLSEMNDTIERFQKKLCEVEDIYIATEDESDLSFEKQKQITMVKEDNINGH